MTEPSKNGVVLCKCQGRVTSKLPLDEISWFLQRMAPDMQVVVGDDLCQTHTLHQLMEEAGWQPVVIGACSQLKPKLYFWEEASKVALNPYTTRIVDLLEETATPLASPEVAERVKLLLWAQIRRASQFKGICPDRLKLHLPRPQGEVSRRDLLMIALPRYEVIPYIEASKCLGGNKCHLCQDSCPLQAILMEEGEVTINKSRCCGCGACGDACPQGAIAYPTFSLEELNSELEGLLLAAGPLLEPRMIALTCQTCLPRQGNEAGGQLRYPPNILPLKIPCLAMASPWLMLLAFARGSQGLILISSREKCPAGFEATKWQGNIKFVQAMLDYWNMAAERLRWLAVAEDNWLDIEQELAQFAQEIARLSPTPLRVAEHTPVSLGGRRLPALIKEIENKLTPSLEGTISSGNVPFGMVRLDSTQCTACDLCVINCPTNALASLKSDDEYHLLFQHEACVACGRCVDICPEDCLRLERILELDRLGSQPAVLFRDGVAKCRRCGNPIAPQSMLARLMTKLQATGNSPVEQLEICPLCKIEVKY